MVGVAVGAGVCVGENSGVAVADGLGVAVATGISGVSVLIIADVGVRVAATTRVCPTVTSGVGEASMFESTSSFCCRLVPQLVSKKPILIKRTRYGVPIALGVGGSGVSIGNVGGNVGVMVDVSIPVNAHRSLVPKSRTVRVHSWSSKLFRTGSFIVMRRVIHLLNS